uniref:SFRICE_007305 n=1 Tax=Spodoptera frugiperda TaxID=7108 RepID=A0A2H1VLV1_SPOFR
MALVFRKAVLPKNVSLLKCLKGRPLATAAKKNPAALLHRGVKQAFGPTMHGRTSLLCCGDHIVTPRRCFACKKDDGKKKAAAFPCRSTKDKNKTLRTGTLKIETLKPLPAVHDDCGRRVSATLRFCMSCPHLAPAGRARLCVSPACCNPSRTRSICHDLLSPPARRAGSSTCLVPCQYLHTTKKTDFAKCPPPPCGCPCPFPCGPCGCPNGCNCLPPPCNGPPKCIQYMTGYYYYPYGFWFCGPYHVTGQCTPVGPCGACPSPCGPCPPPCGPCPPPCCGPCPPPCGPCPPPPPCPCPPFPCPPPKCPRCPCPKCCACFSPVGLMDSCSESYQPPHQSHQPQPLEQSPSMAPQRPSRSGPHMKMKYPLQQQDVRFNSTLPAPLESAAANSSGGLVPTKPQPRRSGISKFFPFNSVAAVDAARHMPHTSVLLCPFTTVQCEPPKANDIAEHFPVYYTPCLKQSKNNFNTRPRQSFSSTYQKPKKFSPTALFKSYSDNYEKRNEIRSPICHRRSRKLNYEVCPLLESPRVLVSPEERDRPTVYPGAFQYANVPNFKRPFPYMKTGFRPCD